MKVHVVWHPSSLDHDPGPGHPERPERLRAILEELKTPPLAQEVVWHQAAPAPEQALLRVHPREYLARLEAVAVKGGGRLDADTVMSRESYAAALHAAGAAMEAARLALRGEPAFAPVRPPGHHAVADEAMGFCLINNVVVAARAALAEWGCQRVLIVDWDVHHGNGTQALVEDDGRIRYVSLHQWPLYPGTGRADERGVGNVFNVPRPPGLPRARYVEDLDLAVAADRRPDRVGAGGRVCAGAHPEGGGGASHGARGAAHASRFTDHETAGETCRVKREGGSPVTTATSRRRLSRTTLLTVLQPWREIDEAIHRRLGRLTDPREGEEVLWIGCGAGRSPLWWAERHGAHVHAIDADSQAIEQAERAAREAGLAQRVVFQRADPRNLPHEGATFDLIVLNALYVDASAPEPILREAARVGRPMSGMVAIVPTWLGTPTRDDEAQISRLGLTPHQLVEWKQFFREAGFVELAVDDATVDGGWLVHGLARTLGRAWRAARWAGILGVLSRPAAALRQLSRRRVLGLCLVKGTRWPHR